MKPTAMRQIGYLILGCGLAVILVAFLGCCGAAKEWRPLLCCVSLFLDFSGLFAVVLPLILYYSVFE
jgi:hypothetical protein